MSKSLAIVQALSVGSLHEARTLVGQHLTESKDRLVEMGSTYVAQSLLEAEGEEYEEEEEEEGELSEKTKVRVKASGEKTKRKVAPDGYKYIDGKLTKVSASEKLARSKGSKRGAIKKKGKAGSIKRKTAKAMKKRKSLGVK